MGSIQFYPETDLVEEGQQEQKQWQLLKFPSFASNLKNKRYIEIEISTDDLFTDPKRFYTDTSQFHTMMDPGKLYYIRYRYKDLNHKALTQFSYVQTRELKCCVVEEEPVQATPVRVAKNVNPIRKSKAEKHPSTNLIFPFYQKCGFHWVQGWILSVKPRKQLGKAL